MTNYVMSKIAENHLVLPGLTFAAINVAGQPNRIRLVLKCKHVVVEGSHPNNPFYVIGCTEEFINSTFDMLLERVSYEVAEERRGLNSAQLREERGI